MRNRKSQVCSLSDFFQAWFFRFFCFFCLFSSVWTVFGSSACRKQRIWYAFSSRWWMGFHWRESSLACNVGEMILSFATSKTTTPQNQVCKRLAPCRARKNTNRLLHGVICCILCWTIFFVSLFRFWTLWRYVKSFCIFCLCFEAFRMCAAHPGHPKWLMISSPFESTQTVSFQFFCQSELVCYVSCCLGWPLMQPIDISCRQN